MNKFLVALGTVLVFYGFSGVVFGQALQSPNYTLDESYIGPGGNIDGTSSNYSTSTTLGDTAVGDSSSASYRAKAGFNTTNDPRLTAIVDTSSVSFGTFSTAAASTATSTFSVLNYTSSGYTVFTVGASPSNSGHNLTPMSSTGPSQAGTEQYGINLRANTSPVSFGADPVQIPDSSFSFGSASTGYSTADNFRYGSGEQIAEATESSGQTNYTISYIVNTATNTPGGKYNGTQSIVVTGTY